MYTLNFIQKCLFFDIETTSRFKTFEEFRINEYEISKIWTDKCLEHAKYKDNPEKSYEESASLYPEYGKVVCISYGYFCTTDNKWKVESLSDNNSNECNLLKSFAKIINTRFYHHILAGFNIKKFDVPFLYRRMLVHKILPPTQFDTWDKKPWDIISLDLYRVWSELYTINSMCSFDLICHLMGVESPKNGNVRGSNVGEFYFNGNIDDIVKYCRKDVQASIKLAMNLAHEKLDEIVN
jgi:predicted PolB exonuclease-like 3'-5' exonuclease